MPRIDIGAVLADKAPRLARWIPGFVIGWLRRTIHESEINYILEHYWNLPPQEFIRACFREWQVTYSIEGLEKLDPRGRYIFASNHPFGGMDGMMLADKLIDRFGDPPPSVYTLVQVALLRSDAGKVGVTDISQKNGCLKFLLAEFDMQKVSLLYARPEFKGRLKVDAGAKPGVILRLKSRDHVIEQARAFVSAWADAREERA